MNRTFVMCKPDAVERGLVGEIVGRLERKGLSLVAAELRTVDKALAEEHYAEHSDKAFYGELVAFLTAVPGLRHGGRGAGRQHVLARAQRWSAPPRSTTPSPGTIRGDLATTTSENLVHGADAHESAAREIDPLVPRACNCCDRVTEPRVCKEFTRGCRPAKRPTPTSRLPKPGGT